MFTKTENFIGMTVAVIMLLVILSFIVSIFIFISFGIIYLLSYLPFIEFHYFSSFWHNVWYFFGFLLLNTLVLAFSEIVVFIDRKNKFFRGYKSFKFYRMDKIYYYICYLYERVCPRF